MALLKAYRIPVVEALLAADPEAAARTAAEMSGPILPKGRTGKDLEWFQHTSCDKKGRRSAAFSPLSKKGAQGDFGLDHIDSNRNIFMTKAI